MGAAARIVLAGKRYELPLLCYCVAALCSTVAGRRALEALLCLVEWNRELSAKFSHEVELMSSCGGDKVIARSW